MEIAIKTPNGQSNLNGNMLFWAIICSMLLHVLLATMLPNFRFDITKDKSEPLTIEIMQPTPPAPKALPEPVTQPEPIKPEPIKKPEIIKEPIKPIKQKSPDPAPIQETNPDPAPPETVPPNVMTAAPKVDAPPVINVPPPQPEPEPPKKTEPSENDISDAKAQYGNTLGRAIAKHKSYPKIAQMRGWQGECLLDLKIDSSGNVLSANVKESSGHESLDNQALKMVRKASPFPTPPDVLRGRSFNITVPVSFKLENA